MPRRGLALFGFGMLVMVDGLVVQLVQQRLGPAMGIDLLLAAYLAVVCLLASFRTGIKLAMWQSLLAIMQDQAVTLGLLGAPPGWQQHRLVGELLLIWLVVLVICQAAAMNERELRRRRYDAEALQSFAVDLHRDNSRELVLTRLRTFLVNEMDAGRVVVCAERGEGLVLLQGTGIDPDAASAGVGRSPLLDLAVDPARPALLLQLDKQADPWLGALLPGARRLVALLLTGHDEAAVWAVFEHRGQGVRVERRLVATAGQAAASARLALSRAQLFQQAQLVALTDGLTGVSNRRAFDDEMARLCEPGVGAVGAVGDGGGLALLLADIDHFKSVNDRFGHQMGDAVLRAVAATLRTNTPDDGMVARFGGEEFAVLLPGYDREAAAAVAEHLRVAVAELARPLRVTASFGVGVAVPGTGEAAAVVADADAALYRAKEGGRNQVALGSGVPAPRSSASRPTASPAQAPRRRP